MNVRARIALSNRNEVLDLEIDGILASKHEKRRDEYITTDCRVNNCNEMMISLLNVVCRQPKSQKQ